jgi:hypothetical protein
MSWDPLPDDPVPGLWVCLLVLATAVLWLPLMVIFAWLDRPPAGWTWDDPGD